MRAAALLLFVTIGGACVEDDVEPVASFDTPTGLAVAGTSRDRLFISNSAQDTVQVLNLGADLTEIDFVFGPAQRVPLRIPAGVGPADLAATNDRRWVIVLNLVSESLRAIDADRLLLARDPDGLVVQMPLGPVGVRPSAMAPSSEACGDQCVGRVYVALAGNGTIVGVDALVEDGVLRFEHSRLFPVGGEPAALAVRPDGRALFATDTASDELIRIDLVTGAFERRLLGGVGGPVAVSSDGSAVIVGRPAARDLVVFRDADGPGLARNDNNAMWAPIPVCTWRCDGDPAECEDAHPADRAVCETDDGLRSSDEVYDGIYLGEVPTHIVTLGAGVGMKSLVAPCGTEVTREFAEFAAVAVLDGSVLFLGLNGASGGPLEPQLVGTTFCNSPTVSVSLADLRGDEVTGNAALDDYLTPCPEIPAGRHRFQCVGGGGESGVVIAPGNTGGRAWSLAWEGVRVEATTELGSQPGAGTLMDVEVGGGQCTDDADCPANAQCHPDINRCTKTVFTDLALTFTGLWPCRTVTGEACLPDTDPADIAFRGDIVEIRTTPIADCPATRCAGSSVLDWRVFERRIVGIEQVDDRTHLELDRAIPAGCFRADGVLDYRIRAGDQWLASNVERLLPGQQLGPGGDTGRGRSEMFGVPARDVRTDLSVCERYAVDGRVACEDPSRSPDDEGCVPVMDPVLRRDVVAQIAINDQFTVFRSGQSLDYDANPNGSAGRIPGGMIVSTVGAPDPVIFLSYAGSNSVLGMVPFDIATAFASAKRYALLR